MNDISKIGRVAEQFAASASTPIPADIHVLVQQAVERTMHVEATKLAVSGDAEGLASLGRSIAVEEGRLLEAVVIALARRSKGMVFLSGLKLPVLEAAVAIIEHNQPDQLNRLSLDPDGRSRRSYCPDLVLVNRASQEAVVIDIKRSVNGYLSGPKLAEFQSRMQAAALALPELLWRDHRRIAVTHVSVAIICADDECKGDGVWTIDKLDQVIGITGSGVIARSAIAAYRRGISSSWTNAIAAAEPRQISAIEDQDSNLGPPMSDTASPTKRGRGRPRKDAVRSPSLHTVTVGLFRPGSRPIH